MWCVAFAWRFAATGRRRVTRALAAVSALVLAPALAGAAVPPPSSDPFYVPPTSLADARPGQILRSRPVDVVLAVVPLTGIAFTAQQVLYRSTDANGQPVANATTVIAPKTSPPPGGRELVSVQVAEDSLDSACAPSYQLRTGILGVPDLTNAVLTMVTELTRGAAVVVPDQEGPDSQLLVRTTEGHAVLDSLRAASQLTDLGLAGTRTKIGLMGYSGGAHATASALELQASYAPELRIVGAAAGGLPSVDQDSLRGLDGGLGASTVMSALTALNRAYPELALSGLLNARGRALQQQVGGSCGTVAVFAAPFSRIADSTDGPDLLATPRVARVVDQNALGKAPPSVPTLVYNGVHDELIKIDTVDALVARYCAQGAHLQYVRDPLGLEHVQGGVTFAALALSFLNSRLDGNPAPSTCPPVPPAPAQTTPTTARPACASRRTVTLHPRVRRGVRVRRIQVLVDGRVSRTLHGVRSRVRVSLAGHPRGVVRVTLRITGRRGNRDVRATDRRRYRVCGAGRTQ